MKKRHINKIYFIILFTTLILPLFSFRTSTKEWVLIHLDSVASVQFPSQPTSQTINGVKAYLMRLQEVAFIAMIIDRETQSTQNSPVGNAHDFYLGVMDSMINDTKSTLTDSTSFNLSEYKGMDFSYVNSLPDGSKTKRRSHIVLIKNKLYCWGYTILGQQTESSKVLSKMFLESFSIE